MKYIILIENTQFYLDRRQFGEFFDDIMFDVINETFYVMVGISEMANFVM